MFRLVTRVTAACDDCGLDYDTEHLDFGGIWHFTSQHEAEASMRTDGWRVHAGGRPTCRSCAAAQDCATHGHHWDLWQECGCGGLLRDHRPSQTGTCGFEYRWCQRCDRHETQPAAPPRTTDGAA